MKTLLEREMTALRAIAHGYYLNGDSTRLRLTEEAMQGKLNEKGNTMGLTYVIERARNEHYAPDFDEVLAGLDAGIYSAKHLNPPSGADCCCLIVRRDGSLGWCDPYGEENGSTFSAKDLCE